MLPMRILSILKLTALAVACAFVPQNACAQDTISTSKDWGVFNVSACNLRSTGDYDAGMESQGLMGMPLRIVQRQSWWQVVKPTNFNTGAKVWRIAHRIFLILHTHWWEYPICGVAQVPKVSIVAVLSAQHYFSTISSFRVMLRKWPSKALI